MVRVDAFMAYSLKNWLTALTSTAAAPVTYALPRVRRKPLLNATFFVSSDAAKDGTPIPAIAGYAHGVYWQHFYSPARLWLPIAVLEFLALAVSIIILAPLLDQAPHVILQTDSLTTAFVLAHDAARSPLVATAHSLLLNTIDYSRLVAGLPSWRLVQVTHTSGDANVAADYLSRGNVAMFTTFCLCLQRRSRTCKTFSSVSIRSSLSKCTVWVATLRLLIMMAPFISLVCTPPPGLHPPFPPPISP